MSIANYLYRDLDTSQKANNVAESLVKEGNLGLKSGKGFYNYEAQSTDEIKKKRDQNYLKLLKIWQEARKK